MRCITEKSVQLLSTSGRVTLDAEKGKDRGNAMIKWKKETGKKKKMKGRTKSVSR